MKSKKFLLTLLIAFVALFIFGMTNVNAATEYEEKLIYKIAPDGENATFKTIKPNDTGEAFLILSNVVNKLLDEDGYTADAYCTDDELTKCVVTIRKDSGEEGAFSKTYNINVTYDEPEENKVVNSIISKMKKFDEDDAKTCYFVSDLNLINLYMSNNVWSQGSGKALKYSKDFIKISEGSDISFWLIMRAGDGGPMFEYAYGDMSVFYDGYNYAQIMQGIYLQRVLYIPEDTKETPEAYVKAAQKRINDYLRTEDEVKVTYGGTLDSLKQEDFYEDVVAREKTDGNYYNITIKGETYRFYIMKGSKEQLEKPKYKGRHIKSDIKITTDDSTVPLDTHLTVETVKSEEIENAIGTNIYDAYDIKLYSDGKNASITKLDNGNFLVSIPVSSSLNGKEVVTYYLNSNNELEEYETVVKDGIASFETDHFSTYILAEKPATQDTTETTTETTIKDTLDDEPPTGTTDIIKYVVVLTFVSVLGIIVLKKKETK